MQSTDKKEYERRQEITITLPFQFLLLCKLVQIPPRQMLYDFMVNLGQESYSKQDPEAKQYAMEYFISCNYGQDFYTMRDIRDVFKELQAIASLYPREGKMKFKEQHVEWRDSYYKYWFTKWWRKIRRK